MNQNLEAQQYYRITQSSYQALDESGTPFMNLGLWPAGSILEAQRNLISHVCHELSHLGVTQNQNLLELGPGFGGSRKTVYDSFREKNYFGVNCSKGQIRFAKSLNADIPDTTYVYGFFEELLDLGLPLCESLIAIESLLHVADKAKVLDDCKTLDVKHFVLAEICLEDKSLIDRYPLFNPSLKYTWTTSEYEKYFGQCGYDFAIADISEKVFTPWSQALKALPLEGFSGHARVLKQFQESYSILSQLCEQGLAKYVIITAKAPKEN